MFLDNYTVLNLTIFQGTRPMKVGFHLVLTHVIGINLQATVLQAVLGMHLTSLAC